MPTTSPIMPQVPTGAASSPPATAGNACAAAAKGKSRKNDRLPLRIIALSFSGLSHARYAGATEGHPWQRVHCRTPAPCRQTKTRAQSPPHAAQRAQNETSPGPLGPGLVLSCRAAQAARRRSANAESPSASNADAAGSGTASSGMAGSAMRAISSAVSTPL